MEYLFFTYPNCQKCDALKESLQNTEFQGQEFNLTSKESKLKIRDYLKVLKRDDKGGIIIPTLIFKEEEDVVSVINDHEELSQWLRSKG
ncbi:MAG: hypothetical protein GQ544_05080 [Candidatus Aminicenantes bacterium]|nr:hypothetical protein [Candidatus Aminicenantes bacterium]